MKVIDNFLTNAYHKELLGLMSETQFEWHYNANITNDKETHLSEFGFFHIFFDENGGRQSRTMSFWYPGLLQIQDAVNGSSILRSRADMTMYTGINFSHEPHVDYEFENIATVYYVNDSDGPTIIEGNLIEPKANRLVVFDGHVPHTGASPTKHKTRIIINSNFNV